MTERAWREGHAGDDGGVKACAEAAFENSIGHENKNLNVCSRRRMPPGLHEIRHGSNS